MPTSRYNNLVLRELVTGPIFIPASRIITLFTTPLTVIPGTPGFITIPRRAHWYKEAGTAYTIGGATRLQLNNSAGGQFSEVNLAGFMDQSTEQVATSFGPGNVTSGQFTNSVGITSLGLDVQLTILVANITTGTSQLALTIFYDLWPKIFPW